MKNTVMDLLFQHSKIYGYIINGVDRIHFLSASFFYKKENHFKILFSKKFSWLYYLLNFYLIFEIKLAIVSLVKLASATSIA